MGPGGAASCCFLVVRPQGTQSHAAEPALLIMGPQRPELKLMQTLPYSPAGSLRQPAGIAPFVTEQG